MKGPVAAAALLLLAAAPPHAPDQRQLAAQPVGELAAEFAALPGRSGFAVVRLGDDRALTPERGAHTSEQFAIGSTFKLWVLDALAEEIEAGRLYWEQVVPLGPASLPSGISQTWPLGSPVTVQTLATLMIAMSDNTATDTLVHLIGRERIAARVTATGHSAPARMLPLLTTAEAFALKLSPAPLQDAYARAADAAQAALLAGLDAPAVLAQSDPSTLDAAPTAIDSAEWFASPLDIARVFASLRRRADPRVLQILAIDAALPRDLRARYAYAGYKGGSERGVITLAWLLQRRSGEWIVVTGSWNDPAAALDEARFERLARRLVAAADRAP